VDRFPVYIRFKPRQREDDWHLQRAVVTLNDRIAPVWDTSVDVRTDPGIWLGARSGLVMHLRRTDSEVE
jgi:hypothetical protein